MAIIYSREHLYSYSNLFLNNRSKAVVLMLFVLFMAFWLFTAALFVLFIVLLLCLRDAVNCPFYITRKDVFCLAFFFKWNYFVLIDQSYQKPFVFPVSVFCFQTFTLIFNLRPKIGLTYEGPAKHFVTGFGLLQCYVLTNTFLLQTFKVFLLYWNAFFVTFLPRR